jgi:hypothetical protein
MKDCYKLLLSCIASIVVFFVLESPFCILISFFISAISLSLFYARKSSFNVYVFLLCLFLILFFPTNYLTLDVNSAYPIIQFSTTIKNVINTVGTIVVIGIPTLLIGLTIAAFATLQFEQGINLLVKAIVVIVFVAAMTWILNYFGFDLFGWREAAVGLWNKLTGWFGGQVNTYLSDMNTPSFSMLQLFTTFPVILALTGIGSSIFFAFVKQSKKEKIMSKIFGTDEIAINKPGDRGTHSQSIQFIIFFAIFAIIVLGLGLYYNIDDILTYRNQLYFSIYSIIIVGILILLAMGIGCYTKNSIKQTLTGTIIGIFGLFCFFNLFNQAKTFEMLALENPTLIIESIVSQVLFVAPMESLLFHVFLPSLVLYIIYQSKKRYDENEIRSQLLRFEIKRDYLVRENEVYRESNSKSKQNKIQKTQTELFKVEKEIRKLTNILENPILVQSGKSMTINNYVVYIVCVIAFQAIFSFFHWFNSPVSISVFFNSGSFFLYLSAGAWMGYLSYRFGWFTSIAVHAFNNCFTLILLLIQIGVGV